MLVWGTTRSYEQDMDEFSSYLNLFINVVDHSVYLVACSHRGQLHQYVVRRFLLIVIVLDVVIVHA
jgi:hypothetical protein